MIDNGLTIPEAIRRLFDIDVAKESPLLKNKAMSLVRNGLIKVKKVPIVDRSATYLAEGQMTVLHNALLLNAVFHDPKDVKRIFENREYRTQCAETIRLLFTDQSSLLGVALRTPYALKLAEALAGNLDLTIERLPNPFAVLPQVPLGRNLNLLQALLAQASSLAPADSMLLAYLRGDIAAAAEMAESLITEDTSVSALRKHILDKFNEASEFDELLEQFKQM